MLMRRNTAYVALSFSTSSGVGRRKADSVSTEYNIMRSLDDWITGMENSYVVGVIREERRDFHFAARDVSSCKPVAKKLKSESAAVKLRGAEMETMLTTVPSESQGNRSKNRMAGMQQIATTAKDFVGSTRLPESVVEQVNSLKVKELQDQLRPRGITATGLKRDLKKRLICALEEEQQYLAELEKANPSATAKHNDKSGVSAEDSNTGSRSDEVAVRADHMRPEQDSKPKHQVDAVEQSFEAFNAKKNDESDNLSGSVASKQQEVAAVDPTKTVEPQKELEIAETAADKTGPEGDCVNKPEAEQRCTGGPASVEMEENIDDSSTNPASSSGNNQRSPHVKKIGSKIQSAIQMLSAKKPAPVQASKSSPARVLSVKDENWMKPNETKEHSTNVKHVEIGGTENALLGSKLQSVAAEESTGRVLTTPAISGGLSAPINSAGGSGFRSNKAREKNEARKARLAEMRLKSKMAASSNPITSPALPALKNKTVLEYAKINKGKDEIRSKALVAQMRKKAAEAHKKQDSTSSASTVAPLAKKNDDTQAAWPDTIKEEPVHQVRQPQEKTQTSELPPSSPLNSDLASKSPDALSPMDTYEISDHDDSDSEDDDYSEAGNDDKRIPQWAQGDRIMSAIECQFDRKNRRQDPDEIFGEVSTCNLALIFAGNKNARYRKRKSSGNWTKDRVTSDEKLKYKEAMGYACDS